MLFRVVRVWKGDVRATFDMPEFRETSACLGFWPKHLRVGADLVVYANRLPPGAKDAEYFTDICTRTRFTNEANEDIAKLGAGWRPRIR